ncbi:MAG: hypothetical protein LBR49_06700 [Tannerella sp.]|jgi:hypothetical protein|nr:hypothetical protein [Tannerella sp.]
MELKDFISYTIDQISQGVIDAQHECKHGVIINPFIDEGNNGDYYIEAKDSHYPRKRRIHTIDMDIAVTVTDSTEKEGGGKIDIACVSAGGHLQKETSTAKESRIKFSIPICFPA